MTEALTIQSYLQNKNIMGALKHAELWVIRERDNADAWFWRGTAQAAGSLEKEAIKSWETAVDLLPTHRGAIHNLSLGYLKSQQLEKALIFLEDSLKSIPKNGQILTMLAHARAASGKPKEAIDAYEDVFKLSGYDPALLKAAATCARDNAQPEKALYFIKKALELSPNIPSFLFEKAGIELSLGHYEQGFKDYESRWKTGHSDLPSIDIPFWEGQSLKDKHILIHDEQGMGDVIMFMRFLPYLTQQGAKVTFSLRAPLHGLLSDFTPEIALSVPTERCGADYQSTLMSLPLWLKIFTPQQLTTNTPYLTAKTAHIEKWKTHNALRTNRKKIGLIWQGNPNSPAEAGRSRSFAEYLPHIQSDCDYFILQCHDGREELEHITLPKNVTDLGEILDRETGAFEDTAAVMSFMDLIITTDTAPAHLAGALNIRTHLILKKAPEWRWQHFGTKTPWYSSIILFRDNVKDAFIL